MLRGIILAVTFGVIATSVWAAPADEKQWLTCEKNSDCTSIELGCYYWQPVNVHFVKDMKVAYSAACEKSLEAGPKPENSCIDHACINTPYTVKFWKILGRVLQNGLVDKRMRACLDEANITVDWLKQGLAYVEVREPFWQKIDATVRSGTLKDERPLEQVIESEISCQDVAVAAKASFKK
jgi:hypothetical protein